MALAIDASTPSLVTGTTTGVTTGSFTPPDASILVALISCNNPGSADTTFSTPTNTGTALTWTRRARKNRNVGSDGGQGTNGGAEIWTAYNATSQSITVTADNALTGVAHGKGLQVMVLTGGDQTQLTNIITATSTSGLPSATLTGCQAGSHVFAVASDWAQAGLGTPDTGQTIISEWNTAGQMTAHNWRTTNTLSGAGSQTMDLTAPSAENYNLCVLEVVAAAATTTAPPPLPFAPGRTWRRQFKHPQRLPTIAPTGPTNYQQSLSGGLSFTGSQTKSTSHLMTGGLSFTGTLTKLTSHALAGGLSFTGSLLKSTSHLLSGGLSFTGSLATQAVHFFTQSLSASLSFTGSLAKQTSHGMTGGLSFVGSLLKSTSHLLSGGLSFVGSQTRQISHLLTGGLSFTGTLTKRTAHALSGALSFTGSLATAAVHFFTQNLSGGLSFTGSMAKQTGKSLSGGLSFTGSITRRIGKALAGGLSFTGSLPKRIAKGMSSVLSFVGSLAASGGSAPPPLGGNVHGPPGNIPGGTSGTAAGNISGDMHGPSSPGEGGTIS